MKHRLWLAAVVGMVVLATAADAAYSNRWVWVFGWGLGRDSDVQEIGGVLETAAKHGLNGACLSCGLDQLEGRPAEFFERLARVCRKADELGIEIIPAAYSIGYGGGFLGHNRNLAEGLPVRGSLYEAHGATARFVPDHEPALTNGGFEDVRGNTFPGYSFHDQPGEVSFADADIFHGGRTSIRLESFTANPHGHGRVMQEIAVKPRRAYRFSLWVRTRDLDPAGAFQVLVLSGERNLAPREFPLKPAQDWQQLVMVFNSFTNETVRLYAGMWGGRSGKLWLDDWRIEEAGPINILRRPGTPVRIASDDSSQTFEEGRDFSEFVDPFLQPYGGFDRPAVDLKLAAGSRIREGARLRVDWYQPMLIHDSQVTVCMAEPEIYKILDRETKLLGETLHPKRVLLGFDEVRMGGTCEACRGKDMARLLGECTTRAAATLKKNIPGVEVLVWSDMFDPHHNAHGNYYLVEGDFAGSWKHLPKDMPIAVWGGGVRAESLKFFDEQGFRTLVACYYDADGLGDVKAWLDAAKEHDNIAGFMYTPWTKKYGLLGDFGDLLAK
jgi:hypothetical protein